MSNAEEVRYVFGMFFSATSFYLFLPVFTAVICHTWFKRDRFWPMYFSCGLYNITLDSGNDILMTCIFDLFNNFNLF